jgi:hypothetical protein
MNRALPRKIHVGSESGTGCFDERAVGFPRWAETLPAYFRRALRSDSVRSSQQAAKTWYSQIIAAQTGSPRRIIPFAALKIFGVFFAICFGLDLKRDVHFLLLKIET